MIPERKQSVWVAAIIAISIVAFIAIGSYFVEKERSEECLALSVEENCNVECAQACDQLDMTYFRYEESKGMFSADVENCFCEKNKKITQVY